MMLMQAGHQVEVGRLASYFSPDASYMEKTSGYNYNGGILVLKTILGYNYLCNRVRVKGGVYRCMSTIAMTGNMAFVSYRDNNLTETLKAYD
jgi:Zn-dependent M16 (insulinase) family peptidase